MNSFVVTRDNFLDMLPQIIKILQEGAKAEVRFLDDKKVTLEDVLNWEWMDEEDEKWMEEVQKAIKEVPLEKKLADLKKDKKIFDKFFKDLYVD